ncbi:uncharacterized protein LOC143997765 [Lithobates pipiens]
MKELRAVLMVGAVVVVMMVKANPGTVTDEAQPSNLMIDETVLDTEMETAPIADMELYKMSDPVCCKSRYCPGCLCSKEFLMRFLEFEETVEELVTPGDSRNLESGGNIVDCALCRVTRCWSNPPWG